jgi:hypothetical protein
MSRLIKYPTKMEVVMASLRLTIRLKTSDESETWRMAAESQGYSTLNKFIRTVVNKSILDLNANRDEVEQQNRQRIDELEHELDLTKAEVSERDRIIRSLKDEVMELRKEGHTPEIINRRRGLFAEFQYILRTDGRMSRQDFLERVRSKYSFVDLGKLLIEVERELTVSGLIIHHEGGPSDSLPKIWLSRTLRFSHGRPRL